jgi:hypothetical protein
LAGVPVELGLKVCIMEDQHGFILHHQVMEQHSDDQVAVEMVSESKRRFAELASVSMGKGFHPAENQRFLRELLNLIVLPKKRKTPGSGPPKRRRRRVQTLAPRTPRS